MIHPHVLVGIPCYDLTPITSPTFDGSFLAVRPPASGITSSHGLNWAGFYIARANELVLGPFQGKVACTHISFQKGVCGKCYITKQAQRIADVFAFPGHIACDSASRSELCVPIIVRDEVIAEIDLDAPKADYFTVDMEQEMLEAASDIAQAYLQHAINIGMFW